MVVERNQIFILLRSVLRGYRMGLLLGDWQCGIGNVVLAMWYCDWLSMMGPGWGCWGLLMVAAGAAGLVRAGALFDGPPGRG